MTPWHAVFITFHHFIFVVSCQEESNIILILTDDQDTSLGGIVPMVKTQNLVGQHGINYVNAFVTTPICCPSRSSILTGLYQHNHGVVNNSISGGCSSSVWQETHEKRTFALPLKESGYTTFYAGKYLNKYGSQKCGGATHVPPGWDWWIGLIGNSRYYNYSLSVNGTLKTYGDKYLTNVIKDYAMQFLHFQSDANQKFLMVLAPPAPHAPFTPEPKYNGYFRDVKAMRTPNFNIKISKDKHWLLRMKPSPLPNSYLSTLDNVYSHRWETLLTVDDMVETIINELDNIGILDNTFILFTSDNGFHMGQFSLPWDKRQPYEFDLRVPLLVRGPNIPKNISSNQLVLNIDLAPTILTMAGIAPHDMDGMSFYSVKKHPENDKKLRCCFIVEYNGEGNANAVSKDCSLPDDNTLSECSPDSLCKCQDSRNNTYTCIRYITSEKNMQFCRFDDEERFLEVYNLHVDPYQLHNIAGILDERNISQFDKFISKLKKCRGDECIFVTDKTYSVYKINNPLLAVLILFTLFQ